MNPLDSTALIIGLIIVILGVAIALAMLGVPEAVWFWDRVSDVFR